MDEFSLALETSIDNFVTHILSYVAILTSVATITMTFLELFKAVAKLRLSYHKKKVTKWLRETNCLEELLILSVSEVSSANALYDQPTDKMMGQIQSATNVAIDFPDIYPNIYQFLTKKPSSQAAAIETGLSGVSKSDASESDGDIWSSFTKREPLAQTADLIEVQKATKARARIDHFVSRKLDAFQTSTEYEWARLNQYWSVGISSFLLIGLLIAMKVPVVLAIVLAFFGGMIAPFSKDILSGLSSFKK